MADIKEIKEYDEQHIALWQQAFGDTREDIVFFLENAVHKICLCLYNDISLCAMLFLVDCKVSGNTYKYIYAACTDTVFKNRGCMSLLLEYAQKTYGKVILIPADISLVQYYSARKFTHRIDINNIIFDECDEIRQYLFEGCLLEEPFALAYIGD